MQFGVCGPIQDAPAAKAAGFEFIEEHVQNLFQGLIDDAGYSRRGEAAAAALPVRAANCLVPAKLKIVGPAVDAAALKQYMSRVLARAGEAAVRTLVFGSGGARQIPEGFDRSVAKQQIIDFLNMCMPMAAVAGVILVAEPLNRKECNIINSVGEAMEYVRAVNHPNFRCLVDSFHFWLDGDSLDDLRAAMPSIGHVHVADRDGRVAPGESGTADYRSFFRVLKAGDYQGLISVEASNFDISAAGRRVAEFLRKQWNDA